MEEKIIAKSEKPNAVKATKIVAILFLLIAIMLVFPLVNYENKKNTYDNERDKYSWSDWDEREQYDYYNEKYYDMTGYIFRVKIAIVVSLGISVALWVTYIILGNAYIIITNQRIMGSTSYGDKFNYPLANINRTKFTGTRIEIYGNFNTTNRDPLKFNHITNYEEILKVLNNLKQYKKNAQEQLAIEDVRKYENVDNSTKKEDSIVIATGGVVLLIIIISIVALFWSCTSTSSSRYEDNLDSGMDKFINGDYDSATDEEKDAVDGFLDWQSEQD